MERESISEREKFLEKADDTELELFKKKHNLKTDEEAYLLLKTRLCERLGVIF